jgi:glycerophosphoryl diester phosphodiesterase
MTNGPLIIGHRGAAAVAPENTLVSFSRAVEAGADGIEFDVRLARDGVPVIIHDETLQRTALRPNRVADLSATELQQVDVGSWFSRSRKITPDRFAAETVPTLRQLFDLFADNSALLYLEMKCDPTERQQLAAECCRLVAECSIRDRVIVECFDLHALETVRIIDPGMRTAALFEPTLSSPHSLLVGRRLIDRAKSIGVDEIALHYRLAGDQVVEKAKLAGLKVVVWTVDDPAWVERAQRTGIDALITNDPALMRRQRDKLLPD